MLHLGGDDILSGDARDRAAHVGQDEVVQGALPAAHAGADSFLLDVLTECGALLGKLGVEGRGDVARRVPGGLISFEEHLLGVATEELAKSAVHGLLLGASQVLIKDTITTLALAGMTRGHILPV